MLQTQEQPFSRAGSGSTHIKVDQRQRRLHIAMGPGTVPDQRKCREQHWGDLVGFVWILSFPAAQQGPAPLYLNLVLVEISAVARE